jgi:hypothetical protein
MRVLLGAVAAYFAAMPAFAANFLCDEAVHCRVASSAELGALRAGIDVATRGGRLRIDIGITRGVAVNEHVVAVSSEARALIVQVGPGNSAPPASSFAAGALPTIVQNTLDNQTLKTFTVVNASVNSLSILNGLRLAEMMARATLASGR